MTTVFRVLLAFLTVSVVAATYGRAEEHLIIGNNTASEKTKRKQEALEDLNESFKPDGAHTSGGADESEALKQEIIEDIEGNIKKSITN